MSAPVIVHQFPHHDGVVRASITTYRGRQYLDLRVWFEPEAGSGLRPTKKGVTVSVECLEDLEAAVTGFRRALDGIERSSSTWGQPRELPTAESRLRARA